MVRFLKKIASYILILLVAFAGLLTVLYYLQFDNQITNEDKKYAALFLSIGKIKPLQVNAGYDEQIRFIREVQNTVLDYRLEQIGIPLNHTRNLKDFYEYRIGLCYDNSHAIETILRVYGFSTRHISIYYYQNWFERFYIFFDPSSKSHAVTEVKTTKGWMLIDSIHKMLGVSEETKNPLSLYEIRELIKLHKAPSSIEAQTTFKENFIFVYGSYSRTGKLYPPFTSVPDYQVSELLYNFWQNF